MSNTTHNQLIVDEFRLYVAKADFFGSEKLGADDILRTTKAISGNAYCGGCQTYYPVDQTERVDLGSGYLCTVCAEKAARACAK